MRIVDRLVFAKHGPGVIRCQENLTRYILDHLKRLDERIHYGAVLEIERDTYVLTRYALPLTEARQWLGWGHIHRETASGREWLIVPIFLPEDVHTRVFAES